jgi:hypothetical protein
MPAELAASETGLQIAVGAGIVAVAAGGLAAIIRLKARAVVRARRLAATETRLKGLYRTLESLPPPDRLAMVLEALDEGEELSPAVRAADRLATPASS